MTDRHHVQIAMDGAHGTLKLGGHDLTSAVSEFTLRAGVDRFPELELDLIVLTGDITGDDHAVVVIPDETREALIALGWTPPTSD